MTGDKTYTFTRGIDTVHVTIGCRELSMARVRLWLVLGGPGSIVLLLGVVLWPLLIVGAVVLLALVGRLNMIEQEMREQAERKALQQFERFESDRWRAYRALGTSDAR